MSSRLNDGPATSRFKLPALDLNFGNITDGTNIPPPDSPTHIVPPPPKAPPHSKSNVTNLKDAIDKEKSINGDSGGSKRPADDIPSSPAGSSKPGSLRHLFSRTMLNDSYIEGLLPTTGSGPLANSYRPDSQSGASLKDDRKSKRASGWFRRLRSGDQQSKRRSSFFGFDEVPSPVVQKLPSEPPPPFIPELTTIKQGERGLGNDLFKHIR